MCKRLTVNMQIFENYNIESFGIGIDRFTHDIKKEMGKNFQNSYVEFNGGQEDSIIHKGGLTEYKHNPQKRKFLEDILLLGCLFDGYNWEFASYETS